MGYCVVHMQKMKMSACGGIQSHINREHESRTNDDIDYTQTEKNYSFCETDDLRGDIKAVIEDMVQSKKAIRKDAVVCCNFIITSDYETLSEWLPEMQEMFFEETYDYFTKRYGIENVVYANVHMDEKTPHMHLGVVPITKDGRLSAKSLFTPSELKNLQTDFARKVGKAYGLERGVEGSTNKHIEMQRYKLEKAHEKIKDADESLSYTHFLTELAEEELKETKKELEQKKAELDETKKYLAEAKNLKKVLIETVEFIEDDIEAKEGVLEELDGRIEKKAENGSNGLKMDDLGEMIRLQKEKQKEKTLIRLLKRFVELPQIKPIWEKFLQIEQMRNRKSRGFER